MSVHRDPVEKPAPLTKEEFNAQWAAIHDEQEKLSERQLELWARQPGVPTQEDTPADGDLVLPDHLSDGKPLPTFSVSVQADGLEVRLRDQAAVGEVVEELIQTITPAVSLACAEEVRTLIERIEGEYRGVIEPLCTEIRRLRDHLAAGYLGHADNLVPSMDELEKTESGVELEDELDAQAEKEMAAVQAEVDKRVAAANLAAPPQDAPAEYSAQAGSPWQRWNDACVTYQDAVAAIVETVMAERRATADSGMV